MAIDSEAIYRQLVQIVDSMPDFSKNLESKETQQWLGRAYALTQELDPFLGGDIKHATDLLHSNQTFTHYQGKQLIQTLLYRALAVAELRAPASVQGSFIPAGNAFDALSIMSKLLNDAQEDILIVDPYMDEKALSDFVVLAREGVGIRLLADAQSQKPTLKPAADRWIAQYGSKRPLTIKLAPARSLHDRLVAIDKKQIWVLTQSLNSLATRAPASIVRVDAETAALKITAYEKMWIDASLLI